MKLCSLIGLLQSFRETECLNLQWRKFWIQNKKKEYVQPTLLLQTVGSHKKSAITQTTIRIFNIIKNLNLLWEQN